MERLTADAAGVSRAADLLAAGAVIAFPTDTVYGLAAANAAAVQRVYELKGRPESRPLVLMGADPHELTSRAQVGPVALRLMRRFWPGPLTLVLATPEGPVGMRVPRHPLALQLLRAAGQLWTTSANRSGEPDALTAEEVERQLPQVDALLHGDRAPGGTPSTVVDLTGGRPVLLREGAIPRSELSL